MLNIHFNIVLSLHRCCNINTFNFKLKYTMLFNPTEHLERHQSVNAFSDINVCRVGPILFTSEKHNEHITLSWRRRRSGMFGNVRDSSDAFGIPRHISAAITPSLAGTRFMCRALSRCVGRGAVCLISSLTTSFRWNGCKLAALRHPALSRTFPPTFYRSEYVSVF